MSGKIEYLEKYSVAPSPSRDYYGLKVLRDEVILYLWRISHGPHKSPIVRVTSFVDFEDDQSLQDEIQRGFGEYLLEHVQNITCGNRNSLLTLPKCLVKQLVKYLSVKDIIKLSTLSHVANEIFDDNIVWETLYRRYKPTTGNKYEKSYSAAYNWKQLFKEAGMHTLINDQKVSRTRPTIKPIKAKPKKEELTRPRSAMSKTTSTIVSSGNTSSGVSLQQNRKKPGKSMVSRKSSDFQLQGLSIESEKSYQEKKTPMIKSLHAIGQNNSKSLKRQQVSKAESKQEIENKDLVSIKSNETKSTKSKVSSTSIKASESKPSVVKSKTTAIPKTPKYEKPVPQALPSGPPKSKNKIKSKKICQSKSTILSTDKSLVDRSPVIRDNSFDLADLIEASLKNIRSPRSIFDYDFSCLEKPKSCAGDSKIVDETRNNSDVLRLSKMNRIRATLDRLSEKSEPLTAKSVDSDKKSDATAFTPKYAKKKTEKASKSPESNARGFPFEDPDEKSDNLERYGIYSKFPTPRINYVTDEKSIGKKSIDKMKVLRSLGSNSSTSQMASSGKGIRVEHRYALKKSLDNFCKGRVKE